MKPYYLVASLPTLVLGEPPPFTAEAFVARSANLLSAAELKELALVLQGREAEGVSEFSREWVRVDTQLRNAIARVRAARLGADAHPHLRAQEGFDTYIEKAVTDAFTKPHALERELALDRIRWQRLDERVVRDPFGFSAVLAFAVRLRLAARWAAMKDETGRAEMRRVAERELGREGVPSFARAADAEEPGPAQREAQRAGA